MAQLVALGILIHRPRRKDLPPQMEATLLILVINQKIYPQNRVEGKKITEKGVIKVRESCVRKQ